MKSEQIDVAPLLAALNGKANEPIVDPELPWALHYVKLDPFWRRADGGKLYRAKFSRIERVDGAQNPVQWTEQWVDFWATRPTAACREIIASGLEPVSFNRKEFA